MLVMLTDNQILSPRQVCQNCLMANSAGEPRWRSGHLGCGHLVNKINDQQPVQYQCQMGFRLINLD